MKKIENGGIIFGVCEWAAKQLGADSLHVRVLVLLVGLMVIELVARTVVLLLLGAAVVYVLAAMVIENSIEESRKRRIDRPDHIRSNS